jgi:chromosome segregation ATPase
VTDHFLIAQKADQRRRAAEAELDDTKSDLAHCKERRVEAEAELEQVEKERDEWERRTRRYGEMLEKREDALEAAEAERDRLRAEVDRQLARHLCYTGEWARRSFWKDVDAALASMEGDK